MVCGLFLLLSSRIQFTTYHSLADSSQMHHIDIRLLEDDGQDKKRRINVKSFAFRHQSRLVIAFAIVAVFCFIGLYAAFPRVSVDDATNAGEVKLNRIEAEADNNEFVVGSFPDDIPSPSRPPPKTGSNNNNNNDNFFHSPDQLSRSPSPSPPAPQPESLTPSPSPPASITPSATPVSSPSAAPVILTQAATLTSRQTAVREAFNFAWDAYKQYAWGKDELRPVAKEGEASFRLGLTMVDGMDTLFIMNEMDRYREAVEWIDKSMYIARSSPLNVFETTIRVLGG
jgi:hypothetical protein